MPLSEFRRDLVSGEWVLFATGRAKYKPSSPANEDEIDPNYSCPFDDPIKSGQDIIWAYPDEAYWKVMVIKNKYPAVSSLKCGIEQIGPFSTHPASGVHDVIVFKDHNMPWSEFTSEQGIDAITVYKKRLGEVLKEGECTQYSIIFNNYGKRAGASVPHPHSQVISLPILPPDVERSIRGSYRYFKEHSQSVYTVILDWELKEGTRIIYQNEYFIALCPYVSKSPYEIRIFSKENFAHFEKMPNELDASLADVLIVSLKKIKKVLGDPAYNFFIHTAPDNFFIHSATNEKIVEDPHGFYHWHIEILPKLSISAGFELGTGVVINVIDPDKAAEELRNA